MSDDFNRQESDPKPRRSPQKLAKILDLGGRVFDLVKGGASFRQISSVLADENKKNGGTGRGFSHEQCRQWFRDYIALLSEDGSADVEGYRQVCLAQLDDVILNFGPHLRTKINAASDDNAVKLKMKAGDLIIKAVDRKANILGVNKPQAIEVTGKDGKPLNMVTNIIIEPVSSMIEKPDLENKNNE